MERTLHVKFAHAGFWLAARDSGASKLLRLSLHRLAGHPTILVFCPMAFEPVFREQLALHQEFQPQFDGFDAHVLGISIDHAWCHDAFARETGLRFPLLSDISPRGMVSRLYGVYREHEEVSARALFVIDRSGIIRFSQTYPDFFNSGVDDVLTVLEMLRVEENGWQH
jgi:peroxiredoxin